ncbi:MAG: cytochrome C [Leptothrix sp. (in: Bacteria)]|nr:cytochrome C [Leptothrix sp. (in: b-proteobacteria)]
MKPRFTFVLVAAALALAGSAQAAPAEDYIAANKCGKCHTEKTTKKGPSFASLAAKYKGDAGATAKLLNTLKTGGSVDHDKATGSDADLQAVITFILASK